MMAKMFYTLDEAKAALGKNEEEIKQLAREGRLREFRDGPRLMFKADQVEQLKAEMGGGGGGMRDQVDLGVSDTGAPIGLVDTGRGNTGSGISLVDSDMGSRGPTGSVGGLKDDTALAADLGLSGSMGGVPSPGRPGSSASGLTSSRAGVNVLSESEYNADPGAQTAINASVSDQVNLEGIGSGSGLLDLTRESDDTSLGAELLDEIAPGGSRRGSSLGDAAGTAAGGSAGGTAIAAAPVGSRRGTGQVIQVEAADPVANALGAACLGAVAMVILAAISLFSAVLGTPSPLANVTFLQSFLVLVGIGAGLSLVFFVFGLLLAKRG